MFACVGSVGCIFGRLLSSSIISLFSDNLGSGLIPSVEDIFPIRQPLVTLLARSYLYSSLYFYLIYNR